MKNMGINSEAVARARVNLVVAVIVGGASCAPKARAPKAAAQEAASCATTNARARLTGTRLVTMRAIVTAGLKWAPLTGINDAARAVMTAASGNGPADGAALLSFRLRKTSRKVERNSPNKTERFNGSELDAMPGVGASALVSTPISDRGWGGGGAGAGAGGGAGVSKPMASSDGPGPCGEGNDA